MKSLLLLTFFALPAVTFAYVTPELQSLQQAQIQCQAVQGAEVYNGKTVSQVTSTSMMKTFNQDGGAEYVDAKCFLADGVSPEGKDYPIGGCFKIDAKTVKQFSQKSLVMKSKFLNETLEINFQTGQGRYTKAFGGCDWGSDCFSKSADVQYVNCVLR